MAHDGGYGDGYEPPPQTPYPHEYGPYAQVPVPDERAFYQASVTSPYQQEVPLQRSRSMSQAASGYYYDAAGPARADSTIGHAVNNALDNSGAASVLSEDVINKITERVIHSLRAEGINGNQYQPQPPAQQPSFPVSQPQPYSPLSPTSNSTTGSAVPRHPPLTPPSPDHRSSTASSVAEHDAFYREHRELPKDSQKEDLSARLPLREKDGNRDGLRVDLSQRTGARSEDGGSRSRPTPAPRALTDEEETVVEKMWQPLFDSNGQPTARLGQFLRGLALYLIEDYEPKKSLVISPAKMQRFYEETKLSEETYPWHIIFSRLSNSTVAKIYRDLKCSHHYIQASINDPPVIPALTPEGFQTWMTAMIQAYPTAEFNRLAMAVREMPISNADDRKERLPKELSRRLFPKNENVQQRLRCAAALQADGQIPPPRLPPFPPPPTQEPPTNHLDHERSTYPRDPERQSRTWPSDSNASHESTDDGFKPSIPLERERKPYTAKEGTGKIYDDRFSNSSSSSSKPTDPLGARAATVGMDGNYGSSHRQQPAESNAGSHLGHRPRTYSKSGRRTRSPSFGPGVPGYGRSDTVASDNASAYYNSSNTYGGDDLSESRYSARDEPRHRERDREREREYSRDRDRADRYRDDDWARRAAEDEIERKYGRDIRREGDDYHRHSSLATGSMPGEYLSSSYGSSSGGYNPALGTGERRYG